MLAEVSGEPDGPHPGIGLLQCSNDPVAAARAPIPDKQYLGYLESSAIGGSLKGCERLELGQQAGQGIDALIDRNDDAYPKVGCRPGSRGLGFQGHDVILDVSVIKGPLDSQPTVGSATQKGLGMKAHHRPATVKGCGLGWQG